MEKSGPQNVPRTKKKEAEDDSYTTKGQMANLRHDPDTPPLKNNRKEKSRTEANDSPKEGTAEGDENTREPAKKWEKNSQQLRSPPPPLCSSSEGVPCDFSDPSLRLTERERCSAPSPPPSPPPSPINAQTVPCPSRPPHRHSDTRAGGEEGGGGLSQWALVSSRPSHFARWDFVSTHRHKRRQMTINGYNNVLFFSKKQGRRCFVCRNTNLFSNDSLGNIKSSCRAMPGGFV